MCFIIETKMTEIKKKIEDTLIELTETLVSVNKQNYELQEENRKLREKYRIIKIALNEALEFPYMAEAIKSEALKEAEEIK